MVSGTAERARPGGRVAPASARSRADRRTGQRRPLWPFLLSLLVVCGAWWWATEQLTLPRYVLPLPEAVARSLWTGLTLPFDHRESFLFHLFASLRAAAGGFVIGSVVALSLASTCVRSPLFYRTFRPYILGFQSMPKIALAPLLLIWFGFGVVPKVLLSALLVFFPVFVNAYSSMTSISSNYLRLFQGLGANGFQTLFGLQLRLALPAIFAGFEMGVVRALLGVVVAEFLAGREGIGILLIRFQYANNTAAVFAILFVLGVVAFSLSRLVRAVSSRALRWRPAN